MTSNHYFIFLCIFLFNINVLKAQNIPALEGKRGVTIITHGFTPGGKISEEWLNFAKAIRKRAGKGSIFINDTQTGLWKAIDNQNTYKADDEVILIYDWAWASDNLRSGYLEACADHLLAALLNPPPVLALSHSKALLEKPLHLIGHSRGAMLLLMLSHRIGYFFAQNPSINIAQFTLLDAHPAAPMGDCELPGLLGECPPSKQYQTDDFMLRLPSIVQRADNYFRQDGIYEDVVTQKIIGPYDGIKVAGLGVHNFELNDQTLTFASTKMGGAHASIATRWYYGTIDFENEYKHPIHSGWYSKDEKYPAMGPRQQTGFFYSRLGGGQLPARIPEEEKIKAISPENIFFNGDFHVERILWKGKIPGWEGNGADGAAKLSPEKQGDVMALRLERPKFNLTAKPLHFRQHSLSYFPASIEGRQYFIQLRYRVMNQVSGANQLKLSFIEAQTGKEILLKSISLPEQKTDYQNVSIEPSPAMLDKTGFLRVSLEGENNNKIIDIDAILCLKK